jgi:universal stress protein E
MKISNILVCIDPTAQRHAALERAVQLALSCDARLELFACDTSASWNARYAAYLSQGSQPGFVVNLRALLEPLVEPIRQRGIDVSIETALGDPLHEMLLERIGRSRPDLVLKDTHHHSWLRRTMLTHTDWHLIRTCPVPLLLVKPRPWPEVPVLAAAIDPGHALDRPQALDHRILSTAQELGHQLVGDVHVLHAFLPLELTTAPPGVGVGAGFAIEVTRAAETARRAELEKFVALHELRPASLSMRLGVASQVLPELASELHIDLLVMGAVSRSGLQRVFIGSTAEQVLEALPCDVLVIKSPDAAAALPL